MPSSDPEDLYWPSCHLNAFHIAHSIDPTWTVEKHRAVFQKNVASLRQKHGFGEEDRRSSWSIFATDKLPWEDYFGFNKNPILRVGPWTHAMEFPSVWKGPSHPAIAPQSSPNHSEETPTVYRGDDPNHPFFNESSSGCFMYSVELFAPRLADKSAIWLELRGPSNALALVERTLGIIIFAHGKDDKLCILAQPLENDRLNYEHTDDFQFKLHRAHRYLVAWANQPHSPTQSRRNCLNFYNDWIVGGEGMWLMSPPPLTMPPANASSSENNLDESSRS
ncbi:hypothetical protein DSL72_002589 [Monilinia vaccinii-corymbosi]|uniref:Uncharacterized protein n=1 Tax=Monilinia vaccinii-corymbosi TaxID=61207 RepID=A0A8A3PD32_9HELO|nr:hypothetical protein DSL72_002589 [Monilinia vaccinii-corymbosi]